MTCPVVHLELHTGDRAGASAVYAELFGWRPARIASYLALDVGAALGAGIVECNTARPVWLPYVEVGEVAEATERARRVGARVLLEPREGPTGWRAVVATAAGGEVALWQPKEAS
jgi:predicted enzyme related to lactoylglutathione lyase